MFCCAADASHQQLCPNVAWRLSSADGCHAVPPAANVLRCASFTVRRDSSAKVTRIKYLAAELHLSAARRSVCISKERKPNCIHTHKNTHTFYPHLANSCFCSISVYYTLY